MIAILLAGFAFGALMQHARVNRYNVISGMATLENFTVAKVMALAIGVGAPLIALEVELGLASLHVKPLMLGGTIWGGLIFGAGMAILGYCPGTLAISLGQGALDAAVGIAGGLFGGLLFTLALPSIEPLLGPDLGKVSLYSTIGSFGLSFHLWTLAVSAIAIVCAFAVHRREGSSDRTWILTGVGLALLNGLMLLDSGLGRPIGASTAFPYVADLIGGLTDNAYFEQIRAPGQWELIFLAGSFLAGLLFALARKEFALELVPSRWIRYKGAAPGPRIFWAFAGGFLLIFGARMAGGCTSGHILSGGMQLSKSSMIFAAFVFASFLLTGKLFYRRGKA